MQASVATEVKPVIETCGCVITADIWTKKHHSHPAASIKTNNNKDMMRIFPCIHDDEYMGIETFCKAVGHEYLQYLRVHTGVDTHTQEQVGL